MFMVYRSTLITVSMTPIQVFFTINHQQFYGFVGKYLVSYVENPTWFVMVHRPNEQGTVQSVGVSHPRPVGNNVSCSKCEN